MQQLGLERGATRVGEERPRILFALVVGTSGWLELAGAFIRPRPGDWTDDLFLDRTVLIGVLAAIGIGLCIRVVRIGEPQRWAALGGMAVNASVAILMTRRLAQVAGLFE